MRRPGASAPRVARGSVPRQKPKALSTEAASAGGPGRSSCEIPACWGGGGAKGPAHQECSFEQPGRAPREEARRTLPTSQVKPFEIPKPMVWEAYRRVAANKGAAGVDGQALEEFEADLRDNLYVIWNRMSSGSYFPPPVRAVEIPKPHGGGVRLLGVPTIADRVAQTVVAMYLGERVEPRFHPDSYGYRPRKSALDAVGVCRRRC